VRVSLISLENQEPDDLEDSAVESTSIATGDFHGIIERERSAVWRPLPRGRDSPRYNIRNGAPPSLDFLANLDDAALDAAGAHPAAAGDREHANFGRDHHDSGRVANLPIQDADHAPDPDPPAFVRLRSSTRAAGQLWPLVHAWRRGLPIILKTIASKKAPRPRTGIRPARRR
jgi:hypothetical protein